ncbi:MAG: co-chaperone GroES [Planctomycetes bacterium]|nr:co-chaperone GroES [Planctomycetota bacterium]
MSLEPLGDKIVVERLEAQDKTSGGIYLPESAKEKPKQGKVISVGPGKVLDSGERSSMTVKEGELVLFTSYAGTEIKHDGKDLLIMSEDDVMAVLG